MTLDATSTCVVDLDGVVWLAGIALPGALEGVAELRRRTVPLLFATNNAAPTVSELRERLHGIGIEASRDEIVTSAHAAASLVGPRRRAFVVGEAGLREALLDVGATCTDVEADAVVVGLTRSFDYELCDRASAVVRAGAQFVASNTDPTLPTPTGLRPGAGAIVAAIAAASGRAPEVAGKPFAPMAELVLARGPVGAVIGDRASTDGAFAARLGVPFALVTSEVAESSGDAAVTVDTLYDAVLALCR